MTTDAGSVQEETNYMPFGEQREHTGLTLSNYKFTDQELDPETGLYNYGARYYDAVTGRFVSADTIVPDYSNPQSLNRYSYTLNNPLIYVDPTGHVYDALADFYGYTDGSNDFYSSGSAAGVAPIVTFFSYIGLPNVGTSIVNYTAPIIKSEPFLRLTEFFGFSQMNAVLTGQDFRGNEYSETERSNEFGMLILGSLSPSKGPWISAESAAAKSVGRTTTGFINDVTVTSHGKVLGHGTVDVRATVEGIQSGRLSPRAEFRNDLGLLPRQSPGYYQEFVHPTLGVSGAGPQRIVSGHGGELYYTPDHYKTFIPVN